LSLFAGAGNREGDTLEEARIMAIDAIRGYVQSLSKDGESVPTDESIVSSSPSKLTDNGIPS
jgi:predicted RNase H-like HicB family nuclease